MFNVGDRIVYGAEGVFFVSDLASSPLDKNDTRIFYVLRPLFGRADSLIYTPAEGSKISMRAVMTKEEADMLLERLPEIGEVTVEREKNRRECYRDAMKDALAENYIRIIRSVLRRRGEFLRQKKRLPEADVEYEKRAKNCLYGELSVALELPFEQIEALVSEKMTVRV